MESKYEIEYERGWRVNMKEVGKIDGRWPVEHELGKSEYTCRGLNMARIILVAYKRDIIFPFP